MTTQNDVVGGVAYSNAHYLYNVIVMTDTDREPVTILPVEYEEAHRKASRLAQLRKEGGRGFEKVRRVFMQKVNIPATITVQDRHNGAWAAAGHPWAANKQDKWMLRHYGLAVVDAECMTEEDLVLAQLRRLQWKYEQSKQLCSAIRQSDPSQMREVINDILASITPFAPAYGGMP